MTYFNRDLSWLNFNYRVLLEAKNPDIPLYERIRFLSIFSSNLDEFVRVRMAGLLALKDWGTTENDGIEHALLPDIQAEIHRCQEDFGVIWTKQILPGLEQQGVHLYYGELLRVDHIPAVTDYFFNQVLGLLQPLWLDQPRPEPHRLPDNSLYFAVELTSSEGSSATQYGLVNIPRRQLSRFFPLAGTDSQKHYIFLDDVVRQHLSALFPGYVVAGCYSVKINRNADLSIADEFVGEMDANIAHMLDQRQTGQATRLLYESDTPNDFLKRLSAWFELPDSALVAGGRYHSLNDLSSLPNPIGSSVTYPARFPLAVRDLGETTSIFECIKERDYLLHLPYQSYSPVLRFFNEAATDPHVREIYVTLYRIATDSAIATALISAARNGKQVTVFVELKARFDEENNLRWGRQLKAAGVRLVYSIPNLKVHAKTALVKREQDGVTQYYGLLATGNFNENTAHFYTDHVLLTSHPGITTEMEWIFRYLQSREQPAAYPLFPLRHLLIAPFNLTTRFETLIDREIAHQRAGRSARITIKLNNLQEKKMINKLYEASQAGVRIDLIVRAICTLVPGVPGQSETITVRRIVDRYLEHGRIFIFHNDGEPETYLGSADWMNRNLHRRVEVCFPLYDPSLQAQIYRLIAMQLADNVQASKLTPTGQMQRVGPDPSLTSSQAVRSQEGIYEWLTNASNHPNPVIA